MTVARREELPAAERIELVYTPVIETPCPFCGALCVLWPGAHNQKRPEVQHLSLVHYDPLHEGLARDQPRHGGVVLHQEVCSSWGHVDAGRHVHVLVPPEPPSTPAVVLRYRPTPEVPCPFCGKTCLLWSTPMGWLHLVQYDPLGPGTRLDHGVCLHQETCPRWGRPDPRRRFADPSPDWRDAEPQRARTPRLRAPVSGG